MALQRDLLEVHSRLVADRQKFRVLRSWQWAGRTVPLVSCQHDSLMVLFCLILDSYLCHPIMPMLWYHVSSSMNMIAENSLVPFGFEWVTAKLGLWNSLKGELVNSSDLHVLVPGKVAVCAFWCERMDCYSVRRSCICGRGLQSAAETLHAVRSQVVQGLDNS